MAIQIRNQDVRFPLVIAIERLGEFQFPCPFCRTVLAADRIEYRQRVKCGECRKRFQVATKAQERWAARREREQRKVMRRRIRELKRAGRPAPDRISIFGVSGSGKSVYLAALYHCLWNGAPGLRARALHGDDHQHLLEDFAGLAHGDWLAATTRTRAFDLALELDRTRVTLSSLDYPGEVFTDVLFRKRVSSPAHARLHHQVETTMGAVLLIDPEQVVGGRELLDVEFTGIEIAEQLAARGMGEHVAIVLTKRDRSEELIDRHGGPDRFVRRRLPRLAAAVPEAPIFHVSAARAYRDTDGVVRPSIERLDGAEIVAPVESVLRQIDPLYLEFLSELDRDAVEAATRLAEDRRLLEGDAPGESYDRDPTAAVDEDDR